MAVQFAASATFLTSLLALATTLATCNTEVTAIIQDKLKTAT
uniref:Uncharacterized protein n=1 Tax=Setaria italica TaxID=4555 RepID=K3ZMP4_SETIT